MATVTGRELQRDSRYWRSAGPWLILFSALYLLFNVVRVILDPVAFASYAGMPLQHHGDDSWIYVYASRTMLLAAVALVLLYYRQVRILAIYATLSVIAPLWDAALEIHAKASMGTVVRQFVIVAFLLVVAAILARQQRKTAADDAR